MAVLRRGARPGTLPSMAEPTPIARTITSVRREAADAVVLGLDCGHARHVRHRPPLSSHAWVLDDAACEQRLGQSIECLRCGQRLLPDDARPYRRTADFHEDTVPRGLLGDHSTKAGTWGRLWVEHGALVVCFGAPLHVDVAARPGAPVVIPPQIVHRVRIAGSVRFYVEFLAVPAEGG